jgi:rare lipoprotein A
VAWLGLHGCAKEPAHTLEGVASWYGQPHHGQPTASGERFNMYELTAAHRTLPLGTRVRVTNLSNGRSVVVTITDRGPFVKGRIIDLSYAAARRIGLIGPGTAPVQLEVLP